jgi:3-hydroxyisobutyrate dehydrogenase-like beta-hydroxyacid dehydrogenase
MAASLTPPVAVIGLGRMGAGIGHRAEPAA